MLMKIFATFDIVNGFRRRGESGGDRGGVETMLVSWAESSDFDAVKGAVEGEMVKDTFLNEGRRGDMFVVESD
jgi:hypothetical protein